MRSRHSSSWPSFPSVIALPMASSRKSGMACSKGNSTNTPRGLLIYAAVNASIGLAVWASQGRLEPREYDLKEYWTWKGSGQHPWFVRAINKRKARRESSQDTSQSKRGLNIGDEQSSFDHSRQNSSVEDRINVELVSPPAAASRSCQPY